MATSYKPGGGGTYKISTAVTVERITRRATAEEVLQRFIERAENRRPPENDDAEANIRWGSESSFQLLDPAHSNPSIVNNGGRTDPEEPPEVPAGALVFTEVRKHVEEVRIENPEDPEQYVDTTRRVWSLFLGPDGIYRQFIWDNSDL